MSEKTSIIEDMVEVDEVDEIDGVDAYQVFDDAAQTVYNGEWTNREAIKAVILTFKRGATALKKKRSR
jgi:hypothetical protein